MKRIVLLTSCCILIVSAVFGQTEWKKGYIIVNEGDTIYGEVNYRSIEKNYAQCEFRNESVNKIYAYNEISGYGIQGEKHYKSFPDQGVFGEILVLGKMDLYKMGDGYLLVKESQSIVLRNNEYANQTRIPRWVGTFSAFLSDCRRLSEAELKKLRFQERSITNEVVEYNICQDAPYQEYKSDKKWTSVRFGLTGGFTSTTLKTTIGSNDLYYVSSSYSSIDPRIGLSLIISSSRQDSRFFFELDMLYSKSAFSGFEEITRSSLEYHEVFIDFTSLTIPATANFNFPFNKWALTVSGGIETEIFLKAESAHYGELYTDNTVVAYPVDAPFEFRNFMAGFTLGLGLKRQFGKRDLLMNLRYSFYNDISEFELKTYEIGMQRLALNLSFVL